MCKYFKKKLYQKITRKIIYKYKNIFISKEINHNKFYRFKFKLENDYFEKLKLRKNRDIADKINKLVKIIEIIIKL